MKSSDFELERRVEGNHLFGVLGAGAVVFGISIEFCLAVAFREHKSVLENWGLVAADALVGLGVAAEVYFASRSGNASEELRRRATDRLVEATKLAAEANERAANAEKKAAEARERTAQLEQRMAGRSLSAEAFATLVDLFNPSIQSR